MKNRNSYPQEQLQQINDQIKMSQRVSLERYLYTYENCGGYERYLHTDVGTTIFYYYRGLRGDETKVNKCNF